MAPGWTTTTVGTRATTSHPVMPTVADRVAFEESRAAAVHDRDARFVLCDRLLDVRAPDRVARDVEAVEGNRSRAPALPRSSPCRVGRPCARSRAVPVVDDETSSPAPSRLRPPSNAKDGHVLGEDPLGGLVEMIFVQVLTSTASRSRTSSSAGRGGNGTSGFGRWFGVSSIGGVRRRRASGSTSTRRPPTSSRARRVADEGESHAAHLRVNRIPVNLRMRQCSNCGEENPERPLLSRVWLGPGSRGRGPSVERSGRSSACSSAIWSACVAGRAARPGRRPRGAPALSRPTAEAERAGGAMEKFIGDAVVAVFGSVPGRCGAGRPRGACDP